MPPAEEVRLAFAPVLSDLRHEVNVLWLRPVELGEDVPEVALSRSEGPAEVEVAIGPRRGSEARGEVRQERVVEERGTLGTDDRPEPRFRLSGYRIPSCDQEEVAAVVIGVPGRTRSAMTRRTVATARSRPPVPTRS
jgi:hypothetical protein